MVKVSDEECLRNATYTIFRSTHTFAPLHIVTCTKSVPNTSCYVGQGGTTIIGTGFTSEAQLAVLLQSALQAAVQGNALIQSLNTNVVVDMTLLDSTTRQTLPPITPAPLASPVVVPMPTVNAPTAGFNFPSFRPAPTAPTPPTSPAFNFPSFIGGTIAPLPTPAQRPIDVPAPIDRPGDVPPTTEPVTQPTLAVPTVPSQLTFAPLVPTTPGQPTQAPAPAAEPTTDNKPAPDPINPPVDLGPVQSGDDDDKTQQSREGGNKVAWWAWLLTAVGSCVVIFCCFSIARQGRGEAVGDGGFPQTKKRMTGVSHEDDPGTPAYEPPPSHSFVPPVMGTFGVTTPSDNATSKLVPAPSIFSVENEDDGEDESEDIVSADEGNLDGDEGLEENESYTEGGEDGGTYQGDLDGGGDEDEVVEEEVFADELEYYDDEEEDEETFGEEENEEEESSPGTWGQQYQ